MTTVAVVAHQKKSLDGGLDELRSTLAHEGFEPLWYEVPKSKKAPACARDAVDKGADLVFVWGGDGMVQRCIDAVAGTDVRRSAILPAGTANLLATNLGIPKDLGRRPSRSGCAAAAGSSTSGSSTASASRSWPAPASTPS